MKKNIGNFDRVLRLLISAVILILFFTKTISGVLGFVFLIFAIVLIFTAFSGFCGLYKLLGIRTWSFNQA